jgi:hypothetical protein
MATKVAKEMRFQSCVAQRWWENFRDKEEMPYKKNLLIVKAVKALLPTSTTIT